MTWTVFSCPYSDCSFVENVDKIPKLKENYESLSKIDAKGVSRFQCPRCRRRVLQCLFCNKNIKFQTHAARRNRSFNAHVYMNHSDELECIRVASLKPSTEINDVGMPFECANDDANQTTTNPNTTNESVDNTMEIGTADGPLEDICDGYVANEGFISDLLAVYDTTEDVNDPNLTNLGRNFYYPDLQHVETTFDTCESFNFFP